MAEQAPLLEVKNLRVEFPTRRGTLVAVDGVSFAIGRGEVLGVVGESGAGKSLTGMAVIGLLERPGRIAAGEIRLAGERIDNLPAEALRRIRGPPEAFHVTRGERAGSGGHKRLVLEQEVIEPALQIGVREGPRAPLADERPEPPARLRVGVHGRTQRLVGKASSLAPEPQDFGHQQ